MPSVSIATNYGLDDRGVGVRVPVGSRIFSTSPRPDMGPTQTPIQCVPGVKRAGRGADHWLPTSAEIKIRDDVTFFYLCHEAIEASRGMAPSISTLTLDRGASFTSPPRTHWIGGWVGPGAYADAVEKRRILHCRESNWGRPVRSPLLYRLNYPDSLQIRLVQTKIYEQTKLRLDGMIESWNRFSGVNPRDVETENDLRKVGMGMWRRDRRDCLWREAKKRNFFGIWGPFHKHIWRKFIFFLI
jgi:hypothetical protein